MVAFPKGTAAAIKMLTSDSKLLCGVTSRCWSTSVSESSWNSGVNFAPSKVNVLCPLIFPEVNLVQPEDKESSSCFCFPRPPHSPAIADWKKLDQGYTFYSSLECVTFFLTSYQNLLFVTAFELKDKISYCEKNCSGVLRQYFAISPSSLSGSSHQVLSHLCLLI